MSGVWRKTLSRDNYWDRLWFPKQKILKVKSLFCLKSLCSYCGILPTCHWLAPVALKQAVANQHLCHTVLSFQLSPGTGTPLSSASSWAPQSHCSFLVQSGVPVSLCIVFPVIAWYQNTPTQCHLMTASKPLFIFCLIWCTCVTLYCLSSYHLTPEHPYPVPFDDMPAGPLFISCLIWYTCVILHCLSNYCLAPEHPYPVPFDDCLKATVRFLFSLVYLCHTIVFPAIAWHQNTPIQCHLMTASRPLFIFCAML